MKRHYQKESSHLALLTSDSIMVELADVIQNHKDLEQVFSNEIKNLHQSTSQTSKYYSLLLAHSKHH